MSAMLTDRLQGLPGPLPRGETILWQGRPEWKKLLAGVFHARLVAIYFVLLAVAGLTLGSVVGALLTVAAGAACLGVMTLLARAIARTSVYTLTDRRIVMKIGVALPMSFNLPLKQIESADLKALGQGCGDIALRLKGRDRIAFALLWPHVRPWRMRHPEPMLRALPEAEAVAILLYRACAALVSVEAEPEAMPAPRRRKARPAAEPVGAAA